MPALSEAPLTPRQALALMRLRAALRRYACVRCQRAPRQGKNHYCSWCNAQKRRPQGGIKD